MALFLLTHMGMGAGGAGVGPPPAATVDALSFGDVASDGKVDKMLEGAWAGLRGLGKRKDMAAWAETVQWVAASLGNQDTVVAVDQYPSWMARLLGDTHPQAPWLYHVVPPCPPQSE